MDDYDAFLSYASGDQRKAKRVHRFLESYRTGTPRRRLRVFMDRTDIRGGGLQSEIRAALARSRALVICWSPAAAASPWVRQEIDLFREIHGDAAISLVVVGGPIEEPTSAVVPGIELRRHDVRNGWWGRWLKPRARDEMLRLLAFVSGADLRSLRNWHRRRAVSLTALALGLGALPPAFVLSYPVEDWTPLELQTRDGPLRPIAAEVHGDSLWVAVRFRAPSYDRPRNYVGWTVVSRDSTHRPVYDGRFPVRRRLLPAPIAPLQLLEYSSPGRLDSIAALFSRPRVLSIPPFVGQLESGRIILAQTLGATADEMREYVESMLDAGAPFDPDLPVPHGSVVCVFDSAGARVAWVDGMILHWPADTPGSDPTSPSRGLAVAAADSTIWIGVPGWDRQPDGGLWESRDAGSSWRRDTLFVAASSIELDARGRSTTLTVAETGFDRVNGAFIQQHATRVLQRRPDRTTWLPATAPPFSARSEIEFAGVLDGVRLVRVDDVLFRQSRRPLWRVLAGR